MRPKEEGIDRRYVDALAKPFRRLRDYCRLTVTGLENVPPEGAVIVANHTGWIGLDHALLALTLYDHDARMPRTAVHPTFFRVPGIREAAPKLGFFEVSVQRSTALLDAGELVLFFPEAEDGNFKPISRLYKLEPFRAGFARVALAAAKPIVPVAILGGEEANPSLARVDIAKEVVGVKLPLPLNVWPLPVKWRLHVMPPVDVSRYLEGDVDRDAAEVVARDVQQMVQRELENQLKLRGNPFL